MPIEDFQILEDLGKGSFGSVVKARRHEDNQIYALKQIKLLKLKQKDKKNALNQIRFLASISHPNIVSYKQAFYDEKTQNLCVVMQLANGGDLSAKIKKCSQTKMRIKQEFIWKMIYQILLGLNKLHQCNIIHRDIKPANIFFHNGVAQLGDLNVAKHLKDPFTVTQTGTPYYASPQVWNQEPYDYKSDIWSLGCVLYESAMLKPPFRADNPQNLYRKVLIGQYDPLASCYSKQIAIFIQKLLTINHKQRPSCKQLLQQRKLLQIAKSNQIQQNQTAKQMVKTIKFPQNLKQLNEKLPKSQYEENQLVSFSHKSSKNIRIDNQFKKQNKQKDMIWSSKNIISQKCISKLKQYEANNKQKKIMLLRQQLGQIKI